MITLHPYQRELVDGAVKLWAAGRRRIAMVMATGGGKTVTALTIAEMALAAGGPVLWLAHRTELIDQAMADAEHVVPAKHRRGRMDAAGKQYRADLVIGSVQTCSTKSSLKLLKARPWGLIVVDETHHVMAETYLRLLRELGAYNDDGPRVLGVTATLDRTDGLAFHEVFEDVVEPRVGLLRLVREGYLVPPRGIRVRIADLDVSKVKRVAGDFSMGGLGAAMSASMAPQRIVEAWIEHAKGRPTIAFLPTVAVSEEQAAAFRDAGFTAVHLDAKTHAGKRAEALGRFKAGELDVLCNVGLFPEGTNLPICSCVILRMTSSRVVYQQQVGRGLRTYPGKTDCIILDPSGVTGRHRLATLASLDGAPRPDDVPDELLMYEEDTGEREERDAPGVVEMIYKDGDALQHELVDLFGTSHSAWLRTSGGTWFIPIAHGYVYLAQHGDQYDVSWYATSGRRHSTFSFGAMDIGAAMAAGDEYIAANPVWQAERRAPWRSQRTRSGRTKGEQYDARAIVSASALLDER